MKLVNMIISGFMISSIWLGACTSSSSTDTDLEAAMAASDVIIYTEYGNIGIGLYDETPNHKQNFLKLASEGFYDRLTFHRVISSFMIQTGDPRTRYNTEGDGSPGYDLAAEFRDEFAHTFGKIGAAREQDAYNPQRRSSGCQFYIVTGKPVQASTLDSLEKIRTAHLRSDVFKEYSLLPTEERESMTFIQYLEKTGFEGYQYPKDERAAYLRNGGTPHLDFTYTIFGEVTFGMDAVKKISFQPTGPYDRPRTPIRMDSVKVLKPMPDPAPASIN